jgi:catechol 2,3-dioxygenase-like lactoylglutathione lyase family enzyme
MTSATPSVRPEGIHHLALSTANMKEQLLFFTDVLGMELVALFWMHGVKGAWHSFLKFNERSFLSFVHIPKMADIEPIAGISHAGNPAGVSAGGTMQHLSLRVADHATVLAMRDRVRAAGIPVLGELDHGMCRSIYFAGPEGLVLEVASHGVMEPGAWIDPDVVALAGITSEELTRMMSPTDFVPGPTPLAQPSQDGTKYNLAYPPAAYARLLAQSDEEMTAAASVPEAPMATRARLLAIDDI